MSGSGTIQTSSTQVVSDDRSYVFHPWSAQPGPDLLPVLSAEGCWFTDYAGKRYLDMSSQLVNLNLGHQHPALVNTVCQQAMKLCYVGPTVANDVRGEAARLIVERAPAHMSRVFFTSGGAEANENAIRMARLHTGRHKILAQYRSYHGATGGAITLTGDPRRWPSEPGIPGIVHFLGPGFFMTRFINTYITEAISLVELGVAGPVEIDEMVKTGLGWPMGVFELLDDTASFDSWYHAQEYLHQTCGDRYQIPPLARKVFASGYRGDPALKPGSRGGWYDYLGVARKPRGETDTRAPR